MQNRRVVATETENEPRQLPPPRPVAYPCSIPKPEVSEITLLSEDGNSIFWKPESPILQKSASQSQFYNKTKSDFVFNNENGRQNLVNDGSRVNHFNKSNENTEPSTIQQGSFGSSSTPPLSQGSSLLQHLKSIDKRNNLSKAHASAIKQPPIQRVQSENWGTQARFNEFQRSSSLQLDESPQQHIENNHQELNQQLANKAVTQPSALKHKGDFDTQTQNTSTPLQSHNQNASGPRGYDPLSYSSGSTKSKSVSWQEHQTPIHNKGMKQVVPRSVNFSYDSPINVHSRKKENVRKDCNNDSEFHTPKEQSQVIPYDRNDSSVFSNNSPDPYLKQVVDSYNKQITILHNIIDKKDEQLQKLLDNVLSGSASRNHCTPKVTDSPHNYKSVTVLKESATQTSMHHESTVETKSIGINTDVTWSDLIASIDNQTDTNECQQQSMQALVKNSCFKSQAYVQKEQCSATKAAGAILKETYPCASFNSSEPRYTSAASREVNVMTVREVTVLSTIQENSRSTEPPAHEEYRTADPFRCDDRPPPMHNEGSDKALIRADGECAQHFDRPGPGSSSHYCSGVTAYRNFAKNVDKFLEQPSQQMRHHSNQRPSQHMQNHSSHHQNDIHKISQNLQQQLQFYDLCSFIDPVALGKQMINRDDRSAAMTVKPYQAAPEHVQNSNQRLPLNYLNSSEPMSSQRNYITTGSHFASSDQAQLRHQAPSSNLIINNDPLGRPNFSRDQAPEIHHEYNNKETEPQNDMHFSVATEEFLQKHGLIQKPI